jgi:uncharacterized membrane protein
LKSIAGVTRGVFSLDFRSWIQFGLLVLIATLIVRVLFSILAFANVCGDHAHCRWNIAV